MVKHKGRQTKSRTIIGRDKKTLVIKAGDDKTLRAILELGSVVQEITRLPMYQKHFFILPTVANCYGCLHEIADGMYVCMLAVAGRNACKTDNVTDS